jgi:prophage tail gpP-like protein
MFKLKIQGEEFTNFQNFKLNLMFNSIASTFSFDAYFDEKNESQKKLFRPYSYRKCEVFSPSNELLLTGVILNHGFKSSKNKNLVGVGGSSVTGVLETSQISPKNYPLETSGKTVRQIVDSLISPFGLSIGEFAVRQSDEAKQEINQVIEKTASKPTKTIKSYLSELCAQRNLLITNNAKGQIVITRINANQPSIRKLSTGDYTDIGLNCDGQKMHDEITVMRQASKTNTNATQATVRNPFITEFRTDITQKNRFVPNVRPMVKEQKSGEDQTATTAAQNALANEFRSMKFVINVPKWEWVKGQMILPNEIITIPQDPELHLADDTNVFIESVSFSGTVKAQTSVLTCVIPEVYNGQTPKNIFLL